MIVKDDQTISVFLEARKNWLPDVRAGNAKIRAALVEAQVLDLRE